MSEEKGEDEEEGEEDEDEEKEGEGEDEEEEQPDEGKKSGWVFGVESRVGGIKGRRRPGGQGNAAQLICIFYVLNIV